MFDRLSEDQRQVLNIVREGHNVFFTGQGGTARKKNCLLSSVFPAGKGGFGQMMYQSPERSPQDSGMDFLCTVCRPHFLGHALIWPGYFGEHVLGLFGLYPSSLSKSVGFVSLSGKASLASISAAILFLQSWHVYFLLEIEFCWKSCVKRKHGGENDILCLLPCILLLYIEWIWTNYQETSLEH